MTDLLTTTLLFLLIKCNCYQNTKWYSAQKKFNFPLLQMTKRDDIRWRGGDTEVSLHALIPTMFWGRGYSWLLKTQSPNFWPTFHFRGGGILKNWYYWQNERKILEAYLALASQIVLSHTTCMETNDKTI